MSRSCPDSEYCGNIDCVVMTTECRFRTLCPREAAKIIAANPRPDKPEDSPTKDTAR